MKGAGVATTHEPSPETDRALAWERLALLATPDSDEEFEGTVAEVAGPLDRLMTEAYLSDFGGMDVTDVLAALLVIRRLRDILTRGEPYLIEAARELGATWDRLAQALEVGTRQAAERRYTSLKAPVSGSPSGARARIDANRDEAARARARRRFALVQAETIRQLAREVVALADLQNAAHRIAKAGPVGGRAPEAARWPTRLAAELRVPGGGDPSTLLHYLAQVPGPDAAREAGREDLAVLSATIRGLEERQQQALLDVMRRRLDRRSTLAQEQDAEDS